MRILSRYLVASFLGLFAAILLGSLLAIAVLETLVSLDSFLQGPSGTSGAFGDLLVRVPAIYVRDLIPLACFAAAFFGLGLPARRRECEAMRAGGISPQRAALPLLLAAALLSAAALVVNETLVLGAVRAWSRLGGSDDSLAFHRGSFWYHRGNTIYNVEDADREARVLRGVRVFELGRRGLPVRSIRADRVEIAGDRSWLFRGATLRRFDPEDPARGPSVEQLGETRLDVGQGRDLALLSASASTLSLGGLREFIAARGREGRDNTRYRALFHARLTQPLTVLLFALLGLPLGLSVERTRSLAASAVRGFALVGLFFALRATGSVFATGGIAASATAPWLLLTAFGGYGAWRYARMPR